MTIASSPPCGGLSKKNFYGDSTHKPTVLPVQPDGIPTALKESPRWVVWKLSRKGGRWTKVPVQANGTPAKCNDPMTWATFGTVLTAYRTEWFDGIGFMLGGGYVGIDLDDVRDRETGEITAGWAAELIGRAGTSADVSPSGTGAKLFGLGVWAAGWHKRPHPSGLGEIEVYDGGRFFSLTGCPAVGSGNDVADIQPTLDELAILFDPKLPEGVPPPPPDAAGGGQLTDDELLDRIRRSKQGGKFDRLMAGDTSEYGGG